MITFTASHAGKHFGEVRERALSEPVGIERHGRRIRAQGQRGKPPRCGRHFLRLQVRRRESR